MGNKISIFKKYKRASRSPFEGDDSTILLLAAHNHNKGKLEISYQRYIYLHRDNVGRWLGISVSKSIMDEQGERNTNKYFKDDEMRTVLLKYISEIRAFLALFSDEIEVVFGVDSETFLYACRARWRKRLKNN